MINQIINDKNEIISRLVLIGKTRYSIVGTGFDLGLKDTLINLDTGKKKVFNRKKLKEILTEYKAIKIK
jgi:hypothetical protein